MPLFDVNVVYVIILLSFIVLVLFVARLTRLASIDQITVSLRAKIDAKHGTDSFLSKLIWCYWCSAIWVSGLACIPAILVGPTFLGWSWLTVLIYPYLFPAVAYAASWIIDREAN